MKYQFNLFGVDQHHRPEDLHQYEGEDHCDSNLARMNQAQNKSSIIVNVPGQNSDWVDISLPINTDAI